MFQISNQSLQHKAGLLNLASELQNVSKACKIVEQHDSQLYLAINDIDDTKT